MKKLQTVSDALEILSFSGPIKSLNPQTFVELNQVPFNVLLFHVVKNVLLPPPHKFTSNILSYD